MATRRVHRLELSLVLSREEGPPTTDNAIHQALVSKLSTGLVRIDGVTAYRITSVSEATGTE